MDDSERAGRSTPSPSNPPRTPRRGRASLRQGYKSKRPPEGGLAFVSLAERGGFEPPIGYEPIHAFQACDFNHSSTSPALPSPLGEAANYSKDSREYQHYLPAQPIQQTQHGFPLSRDEDGTKIR